MSGGRLERLAPLAGVLYAVIFVIGFTAGGETPESDASAEEVLKHYDDTGKIILSVLALALVAVAFAFFAAALRKHLRATGPEWLATLVFGGAIVYVVGLAEFASSQFALLQAADDKNLQVAQALNVIDNSNFAPAFIGVAIFMLATAWHVLKSRSLPVWIGWVSLVLGVLGFAGPLGFLAFLLTVPWAFVVAIVLYRRQDTVEAATAA